MNREKMIELFKNEYGVDNREIKTFLSPGRVNLIGEHIDYNGGFRNNFRLIYSNDGLMFKTDSHYNRFIAVE